MTISKTICPVCKDDAQPRTVEMHNEFTIYECSNCSLQYSDPIEYSSDSYAESYEGSDAALGKSYEDRLERDLKKIQDHQAFEWQEPYKRRVIEYLVRNLLAGSPVLDIGCGSGVFLAAMKEVGLRPYGMDVAVAPIDMLNRAGYNAITGTLDDLPADWPTPTAVTIIEVIEHLPDPAALLRQIRSLFPQAIVAITVPSQKRWVLRHGRELSDYPPNHLTRWTPRSLTRLLTDAGLNTQIKAPGVRGHQLVTPPERWIRSRLGSNWRTRAEIPGAASNPMEARPATSMERYRRAKTLLYSPFAFYLNRRGYTDHSIIGIGTP